MVTLTASVDRAVELATQLKHLGRYDWFRGQIQNWPLRSSLLRLADEAAREEALAKLNRFRQWVGRTPGLEGLTADTPGIIAVAQHYGLPTNFIDFATAPAIAGFFASHGDAEAGRESCILCLNTGHLRDFWSSLSAEHRPECLNIRVDNLWRLETQKSVFLWCPYANFEEIYEVHRIVFPHAGPVSRPTFEEIYPRHKSCLEVLLDQYFMNEQLIAGTRNVAQWPGATLALAPPGLDHDAVRTDVIRPQVLWHADILRAWTRLKTEKWADVVTPRTCRLSVSWRDDAKTMCYRVADQMRQQLADCPGCRDTVPRWELQARGGRVGRQASQAVSLRLARLWDGLRLLPHSDSDLAEGMAMCATLLVEVLRDGSAWPRNVARAVAKLIPDAMTVEMGSDDGGYSRADVSEAELLRAVRDDICDCLHEDCRDDALGSPYLLLQFIPLPHYLFHFTRLASLFARQLAPTQVLMRGRDDAVFFSPARLATFGLP